MARKLPIFLTVWRSLRFLLNHAVDLMKVGWLLLAVVTVAQVLAMWGGAEAPTGESIRTFEPSFFTLVTTIASIPLAVGFLRLYFDGPGAMARTYFRFGASEWRYLGAQIIIALAMILVATLIIGFFAGLVYLGIKYSGLPAPDLSQISGEAFQIKGFSNDPIIVGLGVMAALCLGVALVLIVVRVIIVPAVIVKEGHLGLARSFELSKGQGWRLTMALILVLLIAESATFGLIGSLNFFAGLHISYFGTFSDAHEMPIFGFGAAFSAAAYFYVSFFFMNALMVGYVSAAYDWLVAQEANEQEG